MEHSVTTYSTNLPYDGQLTVSVTSQGPAVPAAVPTWHAPIVIFAGRCDQAEAMDTQAASRLNSAQPSPVPPQPSTKPHAAAAGTHHLMRRPQTTDSHAAPAVRHGNHVAAGSRSRDEGSQPGLRGTSASVSRTPSHLSAPTQPQPSACARPYQPVARSASLQDQAARPDTAAACPTPDALPRAVAEALALAARASTTHQPVLPISSQRDSRHSMYDGAPVPSSLSAPPPLYPAMSAVRMVPLGQALRVLGYHPFSLEEKIQRWAESTNYFSEPMQFAPTCQPDSPLDRPFGQHDDERDRDSAVHSSGDTATAMLGTAAVAPEAVGRHFFFDFSRGDQPIDSGVMLLPGPLQGPAGDVLPLPGSRPPPSYGHHLAQSRILKLLTNEFV